jgi:hypothetical protein
MGYTTSTVHGIEVPDSAEANNVPEDIGKVVTALEAGSLVKRLTGAAIAALTAPQKPAGLVVYNTTTNVLQISDGTNFKDIPAITATGVWTAWTPSLTSSGTTPTFANVTDESRYTQIGKTVTGKGQVTITAVGTGTYRLPLPVTPKSTATAARRIGFIQIDGGGRVGHYSLEQANGATYCLGVEVGQITPVAYIDATFAGYYLAYGSPVRLSWDFTYEAA